MDWVDVAGWVPAAIWVYLLAGRGLFWLPNVRLRRQTDPPAWPTVTIVVPARNEAEMLAITLPRLLNQDYPGRARAILVDDCSSDETAELARQIAERTIEGPHLQLEVVHGQERPQGWVGKTWALHQGFLAATCDSAASSATKPEFVLFTDADISHRPDSLRLLVATAISDRLDLVSLMARLRTANGWERLIVPAFVYFFSQLYPFRLVAKKRTRTGAAAGGCVLVREQALERAGGVAAIAGAVIDDVALAQAVKRSGGSIWLGYGDNVDSVRPYPRLADLWGMVARSAYTQLRHSPLALLGTLLGLGAIYEGWLIVLAVGIATRHTVLVAAGTTAWLLLTLSYVPMLRYYRLNPLRAITLPLVAGMYGAMTIDSAWQHHRGLGAAWKGRTYADPAQRVPPIDPAPSEGMLSE